MTNIFIAYPANPPGIGEAIEKAKELTQDRKPLEVSTWVRPDLGGHQLIQPILDAIQGSDIVVADVTASNFNVMYELGYGIGLGKRVLPIRNLAYEFDTAEAQRVGIIDTLLRQEYTTSTQIVDIIWRADSGQRLATNFPLDPQPLYIVLPEVQTDDIAQLTARGLKAGLRSRTFDPGEQIRLSAVEAIRSVATSSGVVLPLLAPDIRGAKVHNLRIAFAAGIAHALDRPTLLLKKGDWAAPLDIRDEVQSYDLERHLGTIFSEFAERVHDVRFAAASEAKRYDVGLATLNLGDPAAENEEAQLEQYFLERGEFRQVLDGRANIVIGRKGSGKTAVYVRARDQLRSFRSKVVVDLNPKSHELRKLKDVVLRCLAAGSKEFLLSAFWEYVLLIEICAKLLEKDQEVHKRNHVLFEPYQRLLAFFRAEPASAGLEFSDRLSRLIERIAVTYRGQFGEEVEVALSQDDLTNLLYETTISDLRREIEAYVQHKDGVFVLFDNLDKGWNATGLEEADTIMIRTLLDAGRKLKNDLGRSGTDFYCIVFLRNDVYDVLLSNTPDRGKLTSVLVDWSQADLLKQMVRRRLLFNTEEKSLSIDELWHKVSVPMIGDENSLDYLIGRSLMRPRYLLRLINYCVGNAINFGRNRVDEEDIRVGVSQYSTDVITEIDLEIRDIIADIGDILYIFLGEPRRMTKSDIYGLLAKKLGSRQRCDLVFALLLWHGLLGLVRTKGQPTYIYDVNYDLRRLTGLMDKQDDGDPKMEMNPAFWPGLEMA